jgi:CubicO group peptidase (beta-lactamase class C family)
MPRWLGRRWLVVVLVGGLGLVIVVLGVYAWAWLSTDRSTIARAVIWMDADVGDQERFPSRTIPRGGDVTSLGIEREVELHATTQDGPESLDAVLGGTQTRAFLVVHQDHIVYERYFDNAAEDRLETSFSVAKSFVSTLIGIAIDQGLIGSVDDPVTQYVPELAERDPRFTQISLGDLMTMRSGLRYRESGFPWPFGDDTYTYYGVDLRDVALERTKFESSPGEKWLYNNYNPLLLGLVLERTTGMSVSDYLARELWQPLGAAADASWSLDSEGSAFEKMESGINATLRDYARFGLLFLHDGELNDQQIVPSQWVREATSAQTSTGYANPYGYFWWIDGQRPGRFYAFGNYGQYVYVDPVDRTVIVRLGSDWGMGNEEWLSLYREVIDQLG